MSTTTDTIVRLNIVESYKVIKEVIAVDFATFFELDQTEMNSYFIIKSRLQFDRPRIVRDNVFYLKNELGKTPILILNLQTVENRIISNKLKEKQPNDIEQL